MPARVTISQLVTMHQTMFKCASKVPMLGGTSLGGGTCTLKVKAAGVAVWGITNNYVGTALGGVAWVGVEWLICLGNTIKIYQSQAKKSTQLSTTNKIPKLHQQQGSSNANNNAPPMLNQMTSTIRKNDNQ